MKKFKYIVAASMLLAMSTQAALVDRGNGMIYDDVLDVTWLQDASYATTSGFDPDGRMNWFDASLWVDSLDFGGFSDWRLPSIVPKNGTDFDYFFSFDGGSDRGFNQNTDFNELAYMFAVNLGNTSYFDSNGTGMQSGSESFESTFIDAETGIITSFQNIDERYWTNIANDPITNAAWAFQLGTTNNLSIGESQLLNTSSIIAAWALRDGDVLSIIAPPPVPKVSAPASVSLLGLAIACLLFSRKRLQTKVSPKK